MALTDAQKELVKLYTGRATLTDDSDVLFALRDSIVFFYTPSEVAEKHPQIIGPHADEKVGREIGGRGVALRVSVEGRLNAVVVIAHRSYSEVTPVSENSRSRW